MTLISIGLLRGIAGQVIFTAAGMGLVLVLRLIMGLPVDMEHLEPALVVGSITGVVGFVAMAGALTDWAKMGVGRSVPVHHGPPKDRPAWTRYLSVDYSHKVIGIQYTATAILVMLLAGSLAMAFRVELAAPRAADIQGSERARL